MRRIRHLITTALIAALLLIATGSSAYGQLVDNVQISGYFQAMPLWMQADLPPPLEGDTFWEYRMQNRLNLRWFINSEWTFDWQMRTRFFAGDLVNDIPFYADLIDMDDGFFNLSWVISEQDYWFVHYIPDRLYTEWSTTEWSVRIGRQRINWGINMVTNPNDIFNIYSFYEFDYPERPGTDAVRIQHFTGAVSRWEIAASPARDIRNSTAAIMYAFNTSGYDIQFLGGYHQNRLAIGGGWAGSIRQSGFKGEWMLFSDLEMNGREWDSHVVLAVSADHMFDNSLFLVAEALYNQAGGQEEFILLGEPLSADNPSFSRFQFTSQASYPFSPVWNGSLAAIWYPDEKAVFISPSVTCSVLQDLDLNILTQIFAGSSDSVFANARSIVTASLKWNF